MPYPPGMTKDDWKHIDGEQHYRQCPMHDDYEHDCSKEAKEYLRPEFSPPCWVLSMKTGSYSYKHIKVDFCPWCGEELPPTNCGCWDISQGLKERAMTLKGEER